ncbi:7-carboxy-7-deazaguanine synthase QueE [Clostridium aceticum]|uniref:7-carboxy-7-deazaguanine synthase n=1 Tax=Clostridium aceticum TaxID=84022 RepID=A0A0G3WEL0_9CLOT|nr:radical SAM protein [Clostridium aceticum]AKL96367.1 7-carboxy-7-deazaguanine synthase QueE [Clostridium aceticum]
MLKVNEIFLSIQGEGISTGYPTVFLRLSGCNLRCLYCDTSYSYEDGEEMTMEEVLEKVTSYGYKRVCLTGGEPLLQQEIKTLLTALKEYEINIETNGSVDIRLFPLGEKHRFTMDIKTPSSGEAENNCLSNFKYLRENDEIKIVIGDHQDYLWAKDLLRQHYEQGIITFSPIYNRVDPKKIVQWMLEDGIDARFQLQLHKILWDPEERGV